jgi:hypothetical protein
LDDCSQPDNRATQI